MFCTFHLTFDADLLLQKVTFTLTQFLSAPQKVLNAYTATELSCNGLTLIGQEVCITHVTLSPPRHSGGGRRGAGGGENLPVMSRVVTSGDNKTRTGSVLQPT